MKPIEDEIKTYLVERGWFPLEPADLAKSVMIEGAELLELFQWENHSIEEINAKPELKLNIQKEIADVMIYAIQLAIHLDIDVSDAIRHKLEHIRLKYPAEKVSDKESGIAFYEQQKMKYRSQGK